MSGDKAARAHTMRSAYENAPLHSARQATYQNRAAGMASQL